MARFIKFPENSIMYKRAIVARGRDRLTAIAPQYKKIAARGVWHFFWEEL